MKNKIIKMNKNLETVHTHTHTHTHTGNLKNKKENAITLVALVITIIILLILAGITIIQLTQNGLFEKSKIAKTRTEYTSAKEIIELKLMEIQTECISKGKEKEYNLVEIAEGMKNADNIKIERYYDSIDDLKGIVVSVNQYSKYKFLIGEECEIIRVLIGKVTESTDISDFKPIDEFEKEILGKIEENEGDIIPPEYIGKKLETGDYVQYTANNYSKWITVGTDEKGITKIVSVGATDYYQFSGTDYEDAYEKLDNFCNERYVDFNLATSAESFSYNNNIVPFNGQNDWYVRHGTWEATSDYLRSCNDYGWYFDNHNGASVFKLEQAETSLGGLGESYLVRTVVTLKKNIIIIGGEGTSDSPYRLLAK